MDFPALSGAGGRRALSAGAGGWHKRPVLGVVGHASGTAKRLSKGQAMNSYRRREERQLNLVFAVAMLWCLAVWSGLGYLIQTAFS
jgi:hypothetical protein